MKTFWNGSHARNNGDNDEARPSVDLEKARARTLQFAVKLLAAKARSVAELRERLLIKPWTSEAIVEVVLKRLVECGYLNDERFALNYAAHRVRQRPLGRRRLQRDLALRQVDPETADHALKQVYEEVSEEQLIERAIEKRTRLRGNPGSPTEIKSMINYLLRQGFRMDLVWQRVRAIRKAVTEVIQGDDAS